MRHCTTIRKAAGSIPDWIIKIFNSLIPSDRTVALGLTQPATEMCTRNTYLLGRKGSYCLGLKALPPTYADCLGIREPQLPGALRTCPGLYTCFIYTSLTLSNPVVSISITCFNVQETLILSTDSIYGFHRILMIITDYFPKLH